MDAFRAAFAAHAAGVRHLVKSAAGRELDAAIICELHDPERCGGTAFYRDDSNGDVRIRFLLDASSIEERQLLVLEFHQTAAAEFLQREPTEGAPASERTEVRVLFDDRNIYFGIRAFDSDAAHINAREPSARRRDAT